MELLRSRGHEIEVFARHSDEIRDKGAFGTVQGALATPWNLRMANTLRKKVECMRPHIVHVHNTFPLISPAIFYAIGHKAGRVLTLHNYRLFCPAAIPMREGGVCTECLNSHSVWPAVKHGCYRDSRLATLPLAVSVGLHRRLGTWKNKVDAFITLSDFQRKLMSESGLPATKIYVKPNFYPGHPSVMPWQHRQPYIVFAGRLTAEKGVISLLRAWKEWGETAPELRILGDGELRSELERMASGLAVHFFGHVSAKEALAQIAGARLLVLPSEWFEGFPMVVTEAFAFGTPAAVSNIGPLPYIVQHGSSGVVFSPANSESMLCEIRNAWEKPGLLERLGRGARMEFEKKYTEEANYNMLMNIYDAAIMGNQTSANG